MRYSKIIILLAVLSALAGCASEPAGPYWGSAPKGESQFFYPFPKGDNARHFSLVDAGFWVTLSKEPGTATFSVRPDYTLMEKTPLAAPVYTRAILDNPLASATPFTYDDVIAAQETRKHITLATLPGFVVGKEYTLVLEFYSDEARTRLLDRMSLSFAVSVEYLQGTQALMP